MDAWLFIMIAWLFVIISLCEKSDWLGFGLAGRVEGEKRGGLLLVVDKRADVHLGDLSDLVEGEHVLNVCVEGRLAHCVEILADFKLLLRHAIELSIVKSHVNLVVHVRPFRRVIDLMAEICVTRHEIAGLDKVIKDKLLLNSTVFSLGPPGAQSAQGLG